MLAAETRQLQQCSLSLGCLGRPGKLRAALDAFGGEVVKISVFELQLLKPAFSGGQSPAHHQNLEEGSK